jgi:hypothetical protein
MRKVIFPIFDSRGVEIGRGALHLNREGSLQVKFNNPAVLDNIGEMMKLGIAEGLTIIVKRPETTATSKDKNMPNQTTYVDETTSIKALRALTKDGALDLDQALGAVERLQSAGLLLREPMRKDAPAAVAEA